MIDWDKPLQTLNGISVEVLEPVSPDNFRLVRIDGAYFIADKTFCQVFDVGTAGPRIQNTPTGKTWSEARAGMEAGEVWRRGAVSPFYKMQSGVLFFSLMLADPKDYKTVERWEPESMNISILDATDWVKVE